MSVSEHSRYYHRFLRLEGFFAPYPRFRPRLEEPLPQPVAMTPPSLPGRQLTVRIFAPLLNPDAPDNVEASILSYAKAYFRAFLSAAANPHEVATRHSAYQLLEELYREQQARQQPAQQLELIPREESVPFTTDLEILWERLSDRYFPDSAQLADYTVVWSNRRHRSCLASCNVERQRVIVARAMNIDTAKPFLEPLLYHEMCHAVLGKPKVVGGRRIIHGRDFRELERRHPRIPQLDHWINSGGWFAAVDAYERQERRERKRQAA